MTEVEKLKKKIEELENHLFILDMVDRWTANDKLKHEELQEQLQKAKILLTEELLKDVK